MAITLVGHLNAKYHYQVSLPKINISYIWFQKYKIPISAHMELRFKEIS